ncbi:hypothetical protein BANRA_00019 [Klebsiella pneumoniae]|nr:hypothetical protein BANRA_00019 [Klebsiella pneumoniae]
MHTPARNLLTAGEMDEPFHYRRCEQMYRLSREVACVVSHQEHQDCAS